MMENEILGYRSPLYGRRTGQWHLEPMDFNSCRLFRKEKTFEDQINHFAVAGGIPAYWMQFNSNFNIWRNLSERVLRKGQFLYNEVEFILREELREPRYYFALLQAVAQGKRKLAEICNATGIMQPSANKYLGVLADLHIVEREIPVSEEKPLKSKKGLYRFRDDFFRFWFRYVFPRRGELELGRIDAVIDDIRVQWPQYISLIYEKVCLQLLRRSMDRFFPFSAIGRWWEKNEEIDLVALNKQMNAILFAEVKWSKKPVGINIYEDLKRKAKFVHWGTGHRKEYYCLFNKSGFTPKMIKLAKDEGIALVKEDKWLVFPD